MIKNSIELVAYLKFFKKKLLKDGYNEFQLYPAFCIHYDRTKQNFGLPKETVLEQACIILIEGV